jgi:phosphoribosylglycinamide formyltransferase-1
MKKCVITSRPEYYLKDQEFVFCNKEYEGFSYFREFEDIEKELESFDKIILCNYFKKVEKKHVEKFKDKLLNIHRSLLPSFKGKGMYGDKVLKLVFNSKEKAGITLHLVDEDFDTGKIIRQVEVLRGKSFEELKNNILVAEKGVIESL